MSSYRNAVDSDLSLSRCPDIVINQPHPGQWVLVKQFNMEMREPCEIWRSGVHNQIKKMQHQLTMVCKELQNLDKEIRQKLAQPVTSDDDIDEEEQTDDKKSDSEQNND